MTTQTSLPTGTDLTFEPDIHTFLLKVPYNPFFNEALKKLVGYGELSGLAGYEWVPSLRAWRLWIEDFDKVLELVNKYYGGR